MNRYPFSKKAIKAMLVASLVASPFAGVGAVSATEVAAEAIVTDEDLAKQLTELLGNITAFEKNILEGRGIPLPSKITPKFIEENVGETDKELLKEVVEKAKEDKSEQLVSVKLLEVVSEEYEDAEITRIGETFGLKGDSFLNSVKSAKEELDSVKEKAKEKEERLKERLKENFDSLSQKNRDLLREIEDELKDVTLEDWEKFVKGSSTLNKEAREATAKILEAFGKVAVAPNESNVLNLGAVYTDNAKDAFGEYSVLADLSEDTLLDLAAEFQEKFYAELVKAFKEVGRPSLQYDNLKDYRDKRGAIDEVAKIYESYTKALDSTIADIQKEKEVSEELKEVVTELQKFRDEKFKDPNVVASKFIEMLIGKKRSGGGGGGGAVVDQDQDKDTVKPFPFTDVPTTHWAYEYINTLYQKEIVEGMTATTFAPQRSVTRAEFATMLGRLLDLPAADTHGFSDVPAWAKDSVAELAQAGIVKGIGKGLFNSHAQISRQDMALMIVRAYEQTSGTTIEATSNKVYNDQAKVKAYAKEAVQKLYELKVMEGRPNNLFAPQDASTRAEAAKVMALLLELTEEKEETTEQ